MSGKKYSLAIEAQAVLDFWFGESIKPKWFAKDKKLDDFITERFSNIREKAIVGALDDWLQIPEELLALVIILDQFSRNIFRGSPESFDADSEALEIAKHAIEYKMDQTLNTNQKMFLYIPFMHSEELEDQEESVKLFTTIGEESLIFAKLHHDIITKFGRFPHRNQILGRKSTTQEIKFLKMPNSSF
jgi:uncharacterized protein (DUF924 family)